ncbi:SDR family oxidoreductase [Paenibacillus sp. BSR1-1]|uniref:SDR family NAD(P)-dependent oxidoreductase n=1 Tax=Paenibacillus sp. BSR1-1 TaxID=3020845 RepID=UPI0025B0F21C|nr:SDR family oxidoreductase [Paenibacillus sp. BSR1-1]MDN3016176.1 SDR family oxidoreductase [Paenibacillus sp. BSR1-1]
MDIQLDGKVALVIGGTRGIGKESVLSLAKAGAKVIFSGRSANNANEVIAEASKLGIDVSASVFDVADIEATNSAINKVVEEYGKIDILVANAGINPIFKRAEHVTPEDWDHLMSVNLRGLFFAIQSAGKHMLKQGNGSIVSVSSVTSVKGTLRGLPYVATKGGMDSMTRTLALEWADRGVRVNGVAPGYIETDLTQGMRNHDSLNDMMLSKMPLGRYGKSEEIASMIVFLSSEASSYITGQTYIVDGGYSL